MLLPIVVAYVGSANARPRRASPTCQKVTMVLCIHSAQSAAAVCHVVRLNRLLDWIRGIISFWEGL